MTQPGENVGSVFVELTPEADDFMPKVAAKVLPAAETLGKDIAKRLTAPIADRIGDAIRDGLDATADMLAVAEKTGRQVGDRVGKSIRAAVEAQLKSAFTVKVDADTKAADRKIAALEKRIQGIGNKSVKISADTDDFAAKLGAIAVELAALHPLAKVNLSVDVGAALSEIASVEQALSTLQQAQASFPPLDMGLDETLKKIGTLQGEVTTLGQSTSINVDVDTTGAVAQITALAGLIGSLSPSLSINVTMPDADEVGRRIGREAGDEFTRAFRAAVNTGAPPPVPGPPGAGPAAAGAAGRRDGGAYANRFRAAVDQSLQNLPRPRLVVGRGLTDDEREFREAYRRLSRLQDITIGVDLSEREAMEEMAQVEALLFSIQHRAEAGTTLEFNTRAAQEALRRFREEMNNAGPDPAALAANGRESGNVWGRTYSAGVTAALDNIPDLEIDADTDDVTRAIQEVRFRLSQLRNQRIGIEISAEEAGAEIDRLRLELIRLGQMTATPEVRADTQRAAVALANLQRQLLELNRHDPTVNVDVDTGAATASLARLSFSALAAQAAVFGVGLAGLSLITILVPAAAAAAAAVGGIAIAAGGAVAAMGVAALALSGVVGAVQAVTAAQDETGQSAGQAAQRYNQMKSAADGVRNAERSLTEAQKDAKRAQEDLSDARKAAREEYEDLSLSIRGNTLAQARAADDLAEAEAAFNKVKDDPGASDDVKRDARLTFEEAKLRSDELATRAKRLADAEDKARRVGIEGSDQVVAAKDRIAQANQRVIQATEALATAQRAQAQSATAGANATQSAAQKAQDALAKLTPEGREFVKFIIGLKDQLGGLRAAAERTFLPGLQKGIAAMLPILPAVTLLIERFGTVIGRLAEDFGKALGGQQMTDFLDFLGTTGAKVFENFARAIGNVLQAVGSLIVLFGPFAEDMSAGLLKMTEKFADWAEGFGESAEFKAFMDYVKENGPKLVKLVGELAIVLFKLVVAAAPLGELVLDGLLAFFEWINDLSTDQLVALVVVLGVLAIAFGSIFGVAGLIVAGIAAVVAGLVYAYNRFDAFRNIVDAVAHAWVAFATVMLRFWASVFDNVIRPAAAAWWEFAQLMGRAYLWLWEQAIRPAGEAIARAALWLWHNVLEPAWRGIQVAVDVAWRVLQPIFAAWVVWMGLIGAALVFFWEQVVQPTWQFIRVIIAVVWAAIEVIFGLWVGWMRIVGAAVSLFYTGVIRPVFSMVADVISTVWTQRIRPVLSVLGDFISQSVAPAFRRGVDLLIFWWEALRDGLKRPIKFVVQTVINDGLLGAYRWIAEKFDLPNKDIRVPMPAGFATGGFVSGPGTATSDSIMARLSNGEYVIPSAVVRSLGVDFFDWLIGKKRAQGRNQKPGDGSEGLAFAEGGLVGWLKGAWKGLTDPVGELKKRTVGLLDGIPGGPIARETIAGFTKKVIIDGVIGKVAAMITNLVSPDGAYTGPISADVASVQNWVRAQAGKPYIWASAGPTGYDCSGAVSAVWNLLHGRSPYSHTFSTMNQDPYFPKRNQVGVLTAGWANGGEKGGGRVGHTAANLAGLPFESTGSRGFHVNAVTPYTSFARWGTFDSGGLLLPGLTYAYNGTGKPERILTDEQWSTLNRKQATTGSTYNVYPQRADFTMQDLNALTRRQDALDRLGRPA